MTSKVRVALRDWRDDGEPVVYEVKADGWAPGNPDGAMIITSGSHTVMSVGPGQWIAVWDPDVVSPVNG